MTHYSSKSVPSLTQVTQSFIIKYTHHVVWRRLDLPNKKCYAGFKPVNLPISFELPGIAFCEEANPTVIREKFGKVRNYFSENLVRPVYDALSVQCTSQKMYYHRKSSAKRRFSSSIVISRSTFKIACDQSQTHHIQKVDHTRRKNLAKSEYQR